MPAVSKSQARFFRAVLHGDVKGGPSKAVAKEFVSGVPLSGLPEKVRRSSASESRKGK